MITATKQLHGKINSGLQLPALIGRGVELPRHLREVLDVANPDHFHWACRYKRLVVE